jgi:integrase
MRIGTGAAARSEARTRGAGRPAGAQPLIIRARFGSGVPVVSVHSTRRTCASLLVELDVHPGVAMQILRHR